MRVLSGIQPTGRFHWGNYFGAIRQCVDLQGDPNSAYYFIADLHALTTIRDAERLRTNVRDAALDLIGLGLDPEKASLFVQSDVPEVTQLTWLLLTVTPLGLLERCHAFKEKKARGLTADAGLFNYPILMAADILLYDSNQVPVGEDQQQHIEVARDVALKFNNIYGEVFVIPESKVLKAAGKVPGTDGEKMSKSYGNTIECFTELKAQRKKIMRIQTDSRPMEEPKDPEIDPLYQLYSLFAPEEKKAEMAALYRRGGFGYGQIKKELADAAEAYFAEARERRVRYENEPGLVDDILREGAARVRVKAAEVLERAQSACGIKSPVQG